MSSAADNRTERPLSFAAPFRYPAFTVIWTATLVSNVGGWMYSAASGWLMTSLDPDPLTVALVQAASSLPICLFAIPAGALADIFDKRKFLIVVESITTAVSAIYAVIVGLGWATPGNLLVFTFLIGAAGAMTVPAWQAVVTYLVPKDDLPPAIAANSVGVNISRALGPALGGLTISAYGIVAPFWINAASNLGIVASLLWWRPRTRAGTLLPAERFGQAILAGLRYARVAATTTRPTNQTRERARRMVCPRSRRWKDAECRAADHAARIGLNVADRNATSRVACASAAYFSPAGGPETEITWPGEEGRPLARRQCSSGTRRG